MLLLREEVGSFKIRGSIKVRNFVSADVSRTRDKKLLAEEL